MVNLEFPYKQLKACPFSFSRRSIIFSRPIIPVILIYQKKFVQFEALIDSGADYNIFHGDIAVYLGMKLNKGARRNISGISGGEIKGYEHRLTLKIEPCAYKTKVVFSNQIPSNSLAVLGNKGFFDKFIVKFDYSNKIIKISK